MSSDRLSSPASDFITAPDEAMLVAFPRRANSKKFIPNAIPGSSVAHGGRSRAKWPGNDSDGRIGDFVAGAMGEAFAEAKGLLPEFMEAANSTRAPLRFGGRRRRFDAKRTSMRCDPALHAQAVGYVVAVRTTSSTAIDVYAVQSSRSEALSLCLLEAMRAAKPMRRDARQCDGTCHPRWRRRPARRNAVGRRCARRRGPNGSGRTPPLHNG